MRLITTLLLLAGPGLGLSVKADSFAGGLLAMAQQSTETGTVGADSSAASSEAETFWSSYSGLLITFGPLILGIAGIGLLVLVRKISESRKNKK